MAPIKTVIQNQTPSTGWRNRGLNRFTTKEIEGLWVGNSAHTGGTRISYIGYKIQPITTRWNAPYEQSHSLPC
jgi:hypothetical protein